MKIAVAGGRETADYLTGLLRAAGHKVAVIQEDRAFCEHLSAKYDKMCIRDSPMLWDRLPGAGAGGAVGGQAQNVKEKAGGEYGIQRIRQRSIF